jgi:hypothetical protein
MLLKKGITKIYLYAHIAHGCYYKKIDNKWVYF